MLLELIHVSVLRWKSQESFDAREKSFRWLIHATFPILDGCAVYSDQFGDVLLEDVKLQSALLQAFSASMPCDGRGPTAAVLRIHALELEIHSADQRGHHKERPIDRRTIFNTWSSVRPVPWHANWAHHFKCLEL